MYNTSNKVQVRCPHVFDDGRVCNTRIVDVVVEADTTFFLKCPKCKTHSTVKVVHRPERIETSPESGLTAGYAYVSDAKDN